MVWRRLDTHPFGSLQPTPEHRAGRASDERAAVGDHSSHNGQAIAEPKTTESDSVKPLDNSTPNKTAQPVSLLERHEMIVARIRAGTLTVKDYQREFARFVEQKEAVYREIDARVCDTLNQRWGLKWPERAVVERAMLTRATFMGLLYDYLLVRGDAGSHASFGEDVTDFVTEAFTMAVNATGAQDLAAYAQLIHTIPRRTASHGQTGTVCATANQTHRGATLGMPESGPSPRRTHRRFAPKR